MKESGFKTASGMKACATQGMIAAAVANPLQFAFQNRKRYESMRDLSFEYVKHELRHIEQLFQNRKRYESMRDRFSKK